LPTCPLRGKPCRNWRSLQSQCPPGNNTTLRAEVQRVPYSSHNPARQPSPGAALFPVAPHSLRITSCRAGGGGPIEEYAYLAQAFMETSENPILATDLTSQVFKVGLYKFFSAKNTFTAKNTLSKTGIPALSSSTLAIACAIGGGVQANLRAILARPFVGKFEAPSQILQTSKCPLEMPHVAGICESAAPRWRCSNALIVDSELPQCELPLPCCHQSLVTPPF
jgi:hypothetical protein